MEPDELLNDAKIGNFIELLGKICQIKPGDFVSHTFRIKAAGAKPIPLTDEWFEWAGFKKHHLELSNTDYFEKGPISYNITTGDWYVGAQRINPINREYVHQLQNLYYEVSRKHLTFDFPEWIQQSKLN